MIKKVVIIIISLLVIAFAAASCTYDLNDTDGNFNPKVNSAGSNQVVKGSSSLFGYKSNNDSSGNRNQGNIQWNGKRSEDSFNQECQEYEFNFRNQNECRNYNNNGNKYQYNNESCFQNKLEYNKEQDTDCEHFQNMYGNKSQNRSKNSK